MLLRQRRKKICGGRVEGCRLTLADHQGLEASCLCRADWSYCSPCSKRRQTTCFLALEGISSFVPNVCAQNQRCRAYAQTRRTLRQDGKGGHPIGGGRKKDERKETQQLAVFIYFWATSVRLLDSQLLSGTVAQSTSLNESGEHGEYSNMFLVSRGNPV